MVRYATTSVTSAPCLRNSSAITSRPMSACGSRILRPRTSAVFEIAWMTASARYSAGVRSTFRPWRASRSAVAGPTPQSFTPPSARRSSGDFSSRSMNASTATALEKMIQLNVPARAHASSSGP